MIEKVIIPISANEIAPRFDLATEVLILFKEKSEEKPEEKIIVLSQASADKLCHMILTEGISNLICCGIEDEFYQYLNWKKINIIENVAGPYRKAAEKFFKNELKSGDILLKRKIEGVEVNEENLYE
jgi:predicted Fe-Mo cluster-binding NifX family protein